jgi:hypothetical protein
VQGSVVGALRLQRRLIVVPGWSLSTATWTSSASRYIRGSPRPRLPGAVGPPTVVGDGDDDVIDGALSGELDVAQSPLVSVLCGVDQCLVEAKARSSAAAFDSPVFAKRRRTLDTTAKSDGIVAHHPQAGSERESGTRPGVAGTVAGTRQPDPANRRSDTDLFASESGTDGALSEAFQAG